LLRGIRALLLRRILLRRVLLLLRGIRSLLRRVWLLRESVVRREGESRRKTETSEKRTPHGQPSSVPPEKVQTSANV
jgi:hypothetical protein